MTITAEEYLAKAERAKAAGDTGAEARLRAAAAAVAKQAPAALSAEDYRAKAARAAAAGDIGARDRLLAAADHVSGPGAMNEAGYVRPAGASATPAQPDTFGETASAMMQGPMGSAAAYGRGLMDTAQSPSYQGFMSDPNYAPTSRFGRAAAAAASKVLDAGGLALSGLGAGIAGGIGLATELVPGQNSGQELALGNDLLAGSQFAMPELAGGSSFAMRAASVPARASEAAPAARAAGAVAGDVAAARARGIPVLRSDVKPPRTSIGKIVQRTGESIPIAGTGPVRAAQNSARIAAAKDFVRAYGADIPDAAIDGVTADVLAKHEGIIRTFGGQKTAIVNAIKGKGVVPVPNAVAEIDRQIAALAAQRSPKLQPVIEALQGLKGSFTNQPLDVLEKNRQDLGQMFADPSLAGVKSRGEKAINAIYDPLRNDINAFVKANAGDAGLKTWVEANGRIAQIMGEAKNNALKSLLNKGEATPEVVNQMLFSTKPSDVARLYKSLTPEGQARARTAIVQRALGKAGGMDEFSPEKFKNALGSMGPQIKRFFDGTHIDAATGLYRALKLTEHAAKAGASPLTGAQGVPVMIGALVQSLTGSMAGTVAVLGGIGGLARVYEATGVQRALRLLAKAETPKAQASAMQGLTVQIKKAAPSVAAAAAQGAASETTANRPQMRAGNRN